MSCHRLHRAPWHGIWIGAVTVARSLCRCIAMSDPPSPRRIIVTASVCSCVRQCTILLPLHLPPSLLSVDRRAHRVAVCDRISSFSPTRHTDEQQQTHAATHSHRSALLQRETTTTAMSWFSKIGTKEMRFQVRDHRQQQRQRREQWSGSGSGTCARPLPRPACASQPAHGYTQDEMIAEGWDGGVDAEARLSVVRMQTAAVTHCAPPTPMTLTPRSSPRSAASARVCRLSSTCRQFATAAWATAPCTWCGSAATTAW